MPQEPPIILPAIISASHCSQPTLVPFFFSLMNKLLVLTPIPASSYNTVVTVVSVKKQIRFPQPQFTIVCRPQSIQNRHVVFYVSTFLSERKKFENAGIELDTFFTSPYLTLTWSVAPPSPAPTSSALSISLKENCPYCLPFVK